jgi:hypothetical protein
MPTVENVLDYEGYEVFLSKGSALLPVWRRAKVPAATAGGVATPSKPAATPSTSDAEWLDSFNRILAQPPSTPAATASTSAATAGGVVVTPSNPAATTSTPAATAATAGAATQPPSTPAAIAVTATPSTPAATAGAATQPPSTPAATAATAGDVARPAPFTPQTPTVDTVIVQFNSSMRASHKIAHDAILKLAKEKQDLQATFAKKFDDSKQMYEAKLKTTMDEKKIIEENLKHKSEEYDSALKDFKARSDMQDMEKRKRDEFIQECFTIIDVSSADELKAALTQYSKLRIFRQVTVEAARKIGRINEEVDDAKKELGDSDLVDASIYNIDSAKNSIQHWNFRKREKKREFKIRKKLEGSSSCIPDHIAESEGN